MKLEGRRQSTNVEDRRGKGGKILGFGIGAAIIAGLIALITPKLQQFGINVNESDIQNITQKVLPGASTQEGTNYTPTEKEKEFEVFAKALCKCQCRK